MLIFACHIISLTNSIFISLSHSIYDDDLCKYHRHNQIALFTIIQQRFGVVVVVVFFVVYASHIKKTRVSEHRHHDESAPFFFHLNMKKDQFSNSIVSNFKCYGGRPNSRQKIFALKNTLYVVANEIVTEMFGIILDLIRRTIYSFN